jgi:D-alanyl-lipoteichoic acid acyltransferase DltB (MBOAT superfamily)
MAIGLGLLFGFTLPVNFNAPYRAASIREFWQRWHMTLSRFLRDYLYIPLGGSRRGFARQLMAIMATMLLGGLWHGAGWTFVAWGGLHGLAIGANHVWRRAGGRLPAGAGWALTMLFVFACWVVFRSESFAAATDMLAAMAGGGGWSLAVVGVKKTWMIAAAAALVIVGPTSQRLALDRLAPRRWAAVGVALAFVYMVLHVGTVREVEFIYFQF